MPCFLSSSSTFLGPSFTCHWLSKFTWSRSRKGSSVPSLICAVSSPDLQQSSLVAELAEQGCVERLKVTASISSSTQYLFIFTDYGRHISGQKEWGRSEPWSLLLVAYRIWVGFHETFSPLWKEIEPCFTKTSNLHCWVFAHGSHRCAYLTFTYLGYASLYVAKQLKIKRKLLMGDGRH